MPCPEPDELARFADGQSTAAESDALSKHIDTCAACREVLVTLARTSNPGPMPPRPPQAELPEKGTVIGRYVVLDLKGVGGMGILVSAYDSQLDRKVALKLVRPDLEAKAGAEDSRAAPPAERERTPLPESIARPAESPDSADRLPFGASTPEGPVPVRAPRVKPVPAAKPPVASPARPRPKPPARSANVYERKAPAIPAASDDPLPMQLM